MLDGRPALQQQLILVCPILPGQVEAWRRFVQEAVENKDEAYAKSRTHMNIGAEQIWIHETTDAALAILVIETDQPNQMMHLMRTSEWPFDRWFRQQLLVHLGVDVGTSIHKYMSELLFEWQAT